MLGPSLVCDVTVMSSTQGRINLWLASSSVNFGMRGTWPMVLGLIVGCALQTVIAGMALEVLLHWMAAIRLPLTLAGCNYLMWLSWKIFRAGAPEARTRPQPMTLVGGACFQAINPKAWLMATNVAPLYTGSSGVLTVMTGFTLLNPPSTLIGAALRGRMRRHLQIAWERQLDRESVV